MVDRVDGMRGIGRNGAGHAARDQQGAAGSTVEFAAVEAKGEPQPRTAYRAASPTRSRPVTAGSALSYRLAALGHGGGRQVDFVDFDRALVAPSLDYRPDGAPTDPGSPLRSARDDSVEGEAPMP